MANEEKSEGKAAASPPAATVKPGQAEPANDVPPEDPKRSITLRRIMEGDERNQGKK